jgi:penicillin-binding protein 1A
MRSCRTLIATGLLAAVAGAQETARPEPWRLVQPPQSSLVYARDGSLIGEIGREMRTSVPLASLPRYVPQAFVAVEDQRFYQHDGVDVVGIAGAIKDNLLGGSRGASTITQQLVGNMHPDVIDRRDRSISRKLREQAAAREMEKRYSKAQILEAYLNQIAFGRGWFGIEAASRHYFGKSAKDLTLAEAASLAALPKGPATYDPARQPARNKNRRDAILDLMVEQKFITRAEAAAAQRTPVRTVPNAGYSAAAPYFVDVVRQQLERAGVPVLNGGYRILTTLDPALQRAAQEALTDGLTAVEARGGYRHLKYAGRPRGRTDYLQGAVVALDPATGDVRALVGGRDYAEGPYNRAVNATRQPGSTFKPIVYAAAIKDSLPANAVVADTAVTLQYDRVTYRPKNADGEFLGALTLRDALARSRNPVAVQLWERVSADSVIALARRMGISAPIAPYPSSAIGASAVRPIDLVAAFTTFANLGTPVEPRLVLRVEDRAGRVVHSQGVTRLPPALDTATAFIVRDLMRDAVDRGTATAVRRYLGGAVAGKTGTTDDVTDVWFVGMTPDLVAGVWLGFDRPKPILAGASAGGLAAPIFGQMVARAGRARGVDAWAPPPSVVAAELERPLGALATAATPADRRYTEYFLPGTEPGALRLDARRLFTWGPISF